MATTPNEFDQMLKKALKLFHSNHPNSATEMRLMIDEIIQQKYGPEKMLINTLSQKNLDREKNFPGMIKSPVETLPEPDAIINLTNSPEKTPDPDDVLSSGAVERDPNTTVITGNEDFGDLNCCVCNEMMFTASNRLVECSKCGSLYHQECHKPNITDEEASEHQEHNWMCDSCCNKPSTSASAAANTILIADEPMPLYSKTESGTSSPTSTTSGTSSPALYKRDSPIISVPSKTTKSIKAQTSSTIIETGTEKKSKSTSSKSSSKFSKHEGSHKRKSNK